MMDSKDNERNVWKKQFTFHIHKIIINGKFLGYQIAIKDNITKASEYYQTVYDNIEDIANVITLSARVKIARLYDVWEDIKREEKELEDAKKEQDSKDETG